MDNYGRSTTGRLMALAISIALVGTGASTLMAPGSETTLVFGAALFMPIVLMILSIPHALEGHWDNSVLSMLFLPVAAWVYTSNIAFVREHTGVAYTAIALGVGALGLAARGPAPAPSGAAPAKATAEHH